MYFYYFNSLIVSYTQPRHHTMYIIIYKSYLRFWIEFCYYFCLFRLFHLWKMIFYWARASRVSYSSQTFVFYLFFSTSIIYVYRIRVMSLAGEWKGRFEKWPGRRRRSALRILYYAVALIFVSGRLSVRPLFHRNVNNNNNNFSLKSRI